MATQLEQHPKADTLDTPLPNGWYLQEKTEYGETVFFAQHPESMRSTQTHDDPEDASAEAHRLHQTWINDRATHDDGSDNESETYSGPMVLGGDDSEETRPVEVLDEEAGEYVKVTPEMRAEAQHAVNQIQAGILVTAYWIARIYDEGLYAALGCRSKSEFVDRHLPFSDSQARRYAKIGRRLGSFLPDSSPDQLPAPSDVDGEDVPENLQGVPMSKLHKLTKLDDEDLQSYVETGEWTGPNGETYTREDVLEMARKELDDVVSERAQRLRETVEKEKEKRQTYEELAAKRKEERDALEEQIDENEAKVEAAEDLERKLGPTASKLEEKRKILREAQEHVDEAIRLAGKIGISEDDPEADQQNLQRLLQRANTLADVLREDYAEVLINL